MVAAASFHLSGKFAKADLISKQDMLCNATFRYRTVNKNEIFSNNDHAFSHCDDFCEVRVVPPEYRCKDDIEQWMEEGFTIGRDSALIWEGDWVYDLESRKVVQLDTLVGSHILAFHNGVASVAPTFHTHPTTPDAQDDEYVFAYNLLLLQGRGIAKDTKVCRVGRVAKALILWMENFRSKKRSYNSSSNHQTDLHLKLDKLEPDANKRRTCIPPSDLQIEICSKLDRFEPEAKRRRLIS